jgi:hypothetical protein
MSSYEIARVAHLSLASGLPPSNMELSGRADGTIRMKNPPFAEIHIIILEKYYKSFYSKEKDYFLLELLLCIFSKSLSFEGFHEHPFTSYIRKYSEQNASHLELVCLAGEQESLLNKCIFNLCMNYLQERSRKDIKFNIP